ncbi:MAG: hypothetical protein C4334_13825 [Pyrinomonas sp.]|uniref:hypothetical protein n=1 Tax=Pyrinomonas sp. TaxID=2080306 RepID=UPI003316F606
MFYRIPSRRVIVGFGSLRPREIQPKRVGEALMLDLGSMGKSGARALMLAMMLCLLPSACAAERQQASSKSDRSPTEVVREFYRALRERRFRDAFALSIYRPAVEGLSEEEFRDLQPDFERIAAAVPERFEIAGEQMSADAATVFIRLKDDPNAAPEPVALVRDKGGWLVGDRQSQLLVQQRGKAFFFQARIDAHHDEVQKLLQRIAAAQLVYSAQHDGRFADLSTLIRAGLVPKDLETADSTGYRFQIVVSNDGRSYAVRAEPARYGRTGRLSFYMDRNGIKSKDVGGKPLMEK